MAERFAFTKAKIDALILPESGKRLLIWDEREPGLALRLTGSGARTFYVVRRLRQGATEWVKIGIYPTTSIDQARREAAKVNASLVAGESVAATRREVRKDPTFRDLYSWWFAKFVEPPKRSELYARDVKRQFEEYLAALAGKKAPQITKGDVRRMHADVSKHAPIQANRALGLVRTIFNKALGHELIHCGNPAIGIEANLERSRTRRLMPGEIERFLEAVQAEEREEVRDFVLLALLTGARCGNILGMRWEQFDLDARIWLIPRTKNDDPQAIPLEDFELSILARRKTSSASPWVFPGRSKKGHIVAPLAGWTRILKAAGIADLRIHDLRRTHGSFAADAGIPLNIIGKALGHRSQAATQIYARLALDPVRQAKKKTLGAMLGEASR